MKRIMHSTPPTNTTGLGIKPKLTTAGKCVALLACAQLLSACVSNTLDRYAPPSPNEAWRPAADSPWQGEVPSLKIPAEQRGPSFAIPALPNQLPRLAPVEPDTRFEQSAPLSLAQLIDIAQRENKETKQAWNRAREAALTVGEVESLWLPNLSVNVLSGYQRRRTPVTLPLGMGETTVHSNVHGTIPALTLNWLLFDFGLREAALDGAQYVSLGANILFNASHQKVIRDVTSHYYSYNAARARTELARKTQLNHEAVMQAVQERMDAGVATRVDLALAQQANAQGKLHLVTSEGLERNAYLALVGSLGLAPTSIVPIAPTPDVTLPAANDPITEQRLQDVLSERADIAAAYAAVRAAEAAERVAEAAFRPKVFMAGSLAHTSSRLDVGNLPTLSPQGSSTGVLVGITMPLFDGGLRSSERAKAQVRVEQAQEALQQLRDLAIREVAGAETVLNTALQSYEAATELVATATVAYDAAFESYQHGLVSIQLATMAASQLNIALQAQLDARYAALTAAANLAFVMGDMVAAQDQWLPPPQ